MRYELALLEDRVGAGAELWLPAATRILYQVHGAIDLVCGSRQASLHENQAWHGDEACTLRGRVDALSWRFELRQPAYEPPEDRAGTTAKLARAIELPSGECLMRCDRVDFPPGGVAYTHTHQGPGIRVLLTGRFRVQTGGHTLEIAPGDPWFESGPEPVYAEASPDEPTSFIRVMLLPLTLLGKSSIRYVSAEDQVRPKTQTYTVFVDAPLTR